MKFSHLVVTLSSALPLSLALLPNIAVMAETRSPAAVTQAANAKATPPSPPAVLMPEFKTPAPVLVVPAYEIPVAKENQPSSSQPQAEEKKPEFIEAKPAGKQPESVEKPDEAAAKEPELTPEEKEKLNKLRQADRLYLDGKIAAAQKLYREVKTPFAKENETSVIQPPITDLEKLAPAGRVYWRQSTDGLQQELQTKIMVPLEFLVTQFPEFIPGQLRYAEALKHYNQFDAAIQVLEKATTLYPDQPDLLKAKVELMAETKRWLEASLAARQFALLNPNLPEAAMFSKLAEENLNRYRADLQERITGNAIANIITGALGLALTGNIFGPINAVQTTALLLQGESSLGAQAAGEIQQQLPLIKDEEVLKYVRDLGNKIAKIAGRDDFKYEFYVIKDDSLNAFALPGGKVFVNSGAIMKTNSEAELAGLLAHEISHAVLSHSFQMLAQGNLTANIVQYLPLGGTLANLLILGYSRDMEQQADILGTRLLAASGYAADGLRNLMATLDKEHGDKEPGFDWLSSHPLSGDRINYLEELIRQNNYNRYSFEGVEQHEQIKQKLKKVLAQKPKKPAATEQKK